jgi:simple sugar transport system permease protein
MPLLLTVGGALLFTALILLIVGTSPLETFRLLISGAFSTPARLSDAVMLLAPLVLCSAGLSLTFAAGMYNLGVEGQMTLGAIFGLAVLRWFPELPAPLLWGLAFVVGALGGALWSQIVVVLKLAFRVSEIFAGLGLNFLATGFALYLVAGPWRKQGTAAVTGTDLIPDLLRLPTLDRLRLAPAAPVIALIALLVVWFALTRTHWGLSLRATGLNPAAAERLGVPANRRMAEALGSCGALAGVAGVLQIVAVHFALLANISGGIGLLALLVVLLIRSQPIWILPVALLFASFTIGAIQLPLALNIDSSIAGVLQGALVLFALVGQGLVRK